MKNGPHGLHEHKATKYCKWNFPPGQACSRQGDPARCNKEGRRRSQSWQNEEEGREAADGGIQVSGRISRRRRPRHPYGWHAASWSNGAG
ncbi:unnamed protein product [Miscanthus lutarioriparius]|uniref:Uncharacterized protein n=1 Tax=Miscanthus lutarioriparius TaxID=422564 RepID=A0A811MBS2_9POAL|nr:unnamed protein product [Miscanthus lutarioriparius]